MIIQFYHNVVSTNCLLDCVLFSSTYFTHFFHHIIYMKGGLLFDGQETHLTIHAEAEDRVQVQGNNFEGFFTIWYKPGLFYTFHLFPDQKQKRNSAVSFTQSCSEVPSRMSERDSDGLCCCHVYNFTST